MNKEINFSSAMIAIILISAIAAEAVFFLGLRSSYYSDSSSSFDDLRTHKDRRDKSGGSIDQNFILYSPDRTKKVYLEKEYNKESERFLRQSLVLEDVKTDKKLILSEIKLSAAEAAKRYTEDGCSEENGTKVCCNSVIDFNEFKPEGWLSDDLVLTDQYFDKYECGGTVTQRTVYDKDGKKFFSDDLVRQYDYAFKAGDSSFQQPGWSLGNACKLADGKIAFILQKTIFGGYSYLQYDPQAGQFSGQLVEKDQYLKAKTDKALSDLVNDCTEVTDPAKIKKYFQKI